MPKVTHGVALALACAVVLSGGLAGQGPGAGDDIVFYSARSGNNEIYLMATDRQNPLRITEHPASDFDPAISPNGRDIVFTSNRANNNNDIFAVGSAGGSVVNLTNHSANDGWARWSPDGRQVVFHSNRDGNFEIYVMNWDGGSPTRLTEYPGIDQYPDWSPNGQEIVFRRDTDIHVMHLESREVRRLTTATPLNQMAVWSPNGQQLVFMSARDGYPSVFLMGANGEAQTNLTPKDPGDLNEHWVSRAPSWSRNGRQIYFMSSRPSTGFDTELFVINRDGSGLTRLTYSIGVDGSPRGR